MKKKGKCVGLINFMNHSRQILDLPTLFFPYSLKHNNKNTIKFSMIFQWYILAELQEVSKRYLGIP